MLWFHKPDNFVPIGNAGPTVTIGGKSWVVWTGPRGGTGSSNGSCVVQNSNAPVVSYVATSDVTDWSGDLKPFFTDAQTRGIQSSWYLTDVFGGFEIWSGGNGASVKEFTAIVAP
jgi:glycosyl hydrolase family 12